MSRINEHKFELNNEEYLLTWYDKPRLTKNGLKQEVKSILREYITKNNLPIKIVNSNGNDEVPYTLARKILEYFSNNTFKIKKTSPNVESKKNYKPNSSSITNYTNQIEIEKLNLSKNFKVVMICAGGKHNSFFKAYPKENFVNKPELSNEHHPDDKMNDKKTSWRDYLIKNQSDTNLKKAFDLYNPTKTKYPNIYINLFNRYKSNFFILSAGWGLVNSDYRLPNYNITFSSSSKNKNAIRKNKSIYKDFNQFYDVNMVPLISPEEDIIYVGGKDYLELFYQLTENLPNRKIIYFNSKNNPKPIFGNYLYRRYIINYSTNWHYELANKISNGIIP